MTINFQNQHACTLLKYSGISFISGAVNHGFFSGERSLWTAGIGIVLFVIGALWEHHMNHTENETARSLLQTLLWGTLLSIGLGFFTGGLQHFPDSPARSAWVVPVGFLVSVLAMAASSELRWSRTATLYSVVLGAAVTGTSAVAGQWLQANPGFAAGGGGHGHGTPATALTAQTVSRSITIHMDDQMRFTPDKVDVQMGESILFKVHNMGKVGHEFVLGTPDEISTHAELMRQIAIGKADASAHDHGGGAGAALRVAPGQMGELVVTFPQATTLQIACLLPGHLEAGMKGSLVVGAAQPSEKPPVADSQHKH